MFYMKEQIYERIGSESNNILHQMTINISSKSYNKMSDFLFQQSSMS